MATSLDVSWMPCYVESSNQAIKSILITKSSAPPFQNFLATEGRVSFIEKFSMYTHAKELLHHSAVYRQSSQTTKICQKVLFSSVLLFLKFLNDRAFWKLIKLTVTQKEGKCGFLFFKQNVLKSVLRNSNEQQTCILLFRLNIPNALRHILYHNSWNLKLSLPFTITFPSNKVALRAFGSLFINEMNLWLSA